MLQSIRMAVIIGSAAGLLTAAPTYALLGYSQPDSESAAVQQGDAQAAMQLAATIKAELAKQPAAASVEDLEAVIVFVAGQGNYSDAVIASALDQVAAGAGPTTAQAVQNARSALLKKKGRGTGSIGFGFGGFAPGVSPPGGGNYR